MKCRRAQRLLIEWEDLPLPDDVRCHLDECAACRRYAASQDALRKLLSLKRYEQPDPVAFARLRSAIRERIDDLQAHPVALTLWERLTFEPVPALRYAAVALVVVGVAMLALLRESPQPAVKSVVTVVTAPEPEPVPPAVVPTLETSPAPVVAASVPSNTGSGRLDYGPLPATPVRFDY